MYFWFEDGDGLPDGVSCQAHPSLMVNTSVDLLEVKTAFMGGILSVAVHSDVSWTTAKYEIRCVPTALVAHFNGLCGGWA